MHAFYAPADTLTQLRMAIREPIPRRNKVTLDLVRTCLGALPADTDGLNEAWIARSRQQDGMNVKTATGGN